MRFAQLYPSNFENEIADYLAWWFAIVSVVSVPIGGDETAPNANDILWRAYPGLCPACELDICDCRPGPVRELMSKPGIGEHGVFDAVTQTANRNAYNQLVEELSTGARTLPIPFTCVHIDVDDFKAVNEQFTHSGGDAALKLIAAMITKKVRPRDRLYRYGGDEVVLICPDLSQDEAAGMMRRTAMALRQAPYEGRVLTISVGICEGIDPTMVGSLANQRGRIALQWPSHQHNP